MSWAHLDNGTTDVVRAVFKDIGNDCCGPVGSDEVLGGEGVAEEKGRVTRVEHLVVEVLE